jgi:hypothetical protein
LFHYKLLCARNHTKHLTFYYNDMKIYFFCLHIYCHSCRKVINYIIKPQVTIKQGIFENIKNTLLNMQNTE